MRSDGRSLLYLQPGAPCVFPDPRGSDSEGLVAVGGDLSVRRLVTAYRSGIFPWYEEGFQPLWWSPDPRAVFTPERLHVARSLRRSWRRGGFELRWNHDFERVMRACGESRPEGTWIIEEMVDAYVALHEAGHAHSVEVWADGRLAGGLYGVQVGRLFAAESMFHRVTDASKIAVVAAVTSLFAAGIEVFDTQIGRAHV